MKNKTVIEVLKPRLEQLGKKFVDAPWGDPNFYGAWLAQTTYYVRHSTRLLALAGARTPQSKQDYHVRFIEHAEEEKGHENLTLLDLKHLGFSINDFPEFPTTQSFYQTQYYWIEHENPMAFFGYILQLECLAANYCPEAQKIVESHYGPKGAHFIRVHGKDDIEHVEQAIAKVGKLSMEDQQVIIHNMLQSFSNYENMIAECIQHAKMKAGKKAA